MITSGPFSEMSVCMDYERCCVAVENKNKKCREKKVNMNCHCQPNHF